MIIPMISAIDVINGPLATAGSKPNRVKIKGREIPIILPMKTIISMDRPTTNAIIIPPLNIPSKETTNPIVIPIADATNASFPMQ